MFVRYYIPINMRHFTNHHVKRSAPHMRTILVANKVHSIVYRDWKSVQLRKRWNSIMYVCSGTWQEGQDPLRSFNMLWSIAYRSIQLSHEAAFVNWEHIRGCPPANDSTVKYISVERGVYVFEIFPAFSFSSNPTKQQCSYAPS